MKTIILLPKGELPIQVKKQLMREGYLPLEVSDVEKVKLLPMNELGINGDMLTMAALEAMQGPNSSGERSQFTANLFKRLKAKEEQKKEASQ